MKPLSYYYEEFRKFPTIGVQAFVRKPTSISSLMGHMAATVESKQLVALF